MLALSKALYAVMKADAALVALLGRDGAEPSIKTERPVPVTAARPLILAADTISDVPADLIGKAVGRLIERDIRVEGNAASHWRAVEAAAERVKELFHRNRFSVEGWQTLMVLARGPVTGPTDSPQEVARIVTLQIRLLRLG